MLNVNWKPNKMLSIPLYQQIVNYIKTMISTGEWDVGSKLPTQRELSKIFEVNRSTVVEALDELKAEGLIEGKSGVGTVIVNNTWSLITSISPLKWQNYILSGIQKPNLPTIQKINQLEFKDGMIRLGTGELSRDLYPYDMMKVILNKVSENVKDLGYEEPKGSLHLRETISKYLKKHNINVSTSKILIVSGSLQALQLISMGILKSGSTILVEKPSYLSSLNLFQSYGMNLNSVSMDNFGIKPNEIIKNKKNDNSTLLYTIPTFQNPTGIVMTEERRNEILEICSKERIPIIEDDAYRELWLDKEPPLPLKSKDKNGNVMYLGTASKSIAAGLRVGWLVGPENVIEHLSDLKMQMDYGTSSLSQKVLNELINSGLYDEYLLQLRNQLKIRRDVTLDILKRYFDSIATWSKPQGGFYIWLKLKKTLSLNKLFELSYEKGILINPGNIYDFSNSQNLRISYSYAPLGELEKGLKILSELIKKSYFNDITKSSY
ncbi:PLP-dependent aminotransferase family protein [Clostridium beijerinckii]|uniref:aminotransferase-like domain-containing protein n=1 Tax=Clostridium beijerinckii TaxID=1520 RepID=UPI001F27AC6F|nr:PLP-dependent aminotransferase family protein [Clostridium beijerinckii]